MKLYMVFNNCPLTTPFGNILKLGSQMGKQVIRGGKVVALHGTFTLMMRGKYKKGAIVVQNLKNKSVR